LKESQNLNFAVPAATLAQALASARTKILNLTFPPLPQETISQKPISVPSTIPEDIARATLRKARDAVGGESNLRAVKDITQNAQLTLDLAAGGLKATQTEYWIASGHYREESVLPFGKVIVYSDGKTGWVSSPRGMVAIPDAERKQVSFEIFRMWFPLLTSATDHNRTIQDEANGTIRISDKSGNSVLLTVDPATGLPLSENYSEAGSNGQDVKETYGDWHETNGIKLPRKITITENGKHFGDITITSVTINQGLTPEQLSKKP
jgi:hypothetical protein